MKTRKCKTKKRKVKLFKLNKKRQKDKINSRIFYAVLIDLKE